MKDIKYRESCFTLSQVEVPFSSRSQSSHHSRRKDRHSRFRRGGRKQGGGGNRGKLEQKSFGSEVVDGDVKFIS